MENFSDLVKNYIDKSNDAEYRKLFENIWLNIPNKSDVDLLKTMIKIDGEKIIANRIIDVFAGYYNRHTFNHQLPTTDEFNNISIWLIDIDNRNFVEIFFNTFRDYIKKKTQKSYWAVDRFLLYKFVTENNKFLEEQLLQRNSKSKIKKFIANFSIFMFNISHDIIYERMFKDMFKDFNLNIQNIDTLPDYSKGILKILSKFDVSIDHSADQLFKQFYNYVFRILIPKYPIYKNILEI